MLISVTKWREIQMKKFSLVVILCLLALVCVTGTSVYAKGKTMGTTGVSTDAPTAGVKGGATENAQTDEQLMKDLTEVQKNTEEKVYSDATKETIKENKDNLNTDDK